MTIEEILKLRQEAGGLNKLMHMHVVTLDKDGGAPVERDGHRALRRRRRAGCNVAQREDRAAVRHAERIEQLGGHV